MKTTTETGLGRLILLLAHVAGMVDLVALPVWVGTALIGQYGLSAPMAGGMVTSYLVAVAVASMIFAPKFLRIDARKAAPLGYAAAALAFLILTRTHNPVLMFALHIVGGFSAGTALSFVHGTIGRSARPHRVFAIVTLGLGVTGILFLGLAQSIVPMYGGYVLFAMFAGLMAVAALATGVAYPASPAAVADGSGAYGSPALQSQAPMALGIWYGILGITTMSVCQAMMFSFVERIGVAMGFADQIRNLLVAAALVNLAAAAAAGLLERRLKALLVALGGAAVQAALALIIVFGGSAVPYAIGTLFLVSAMIVTHTFIFGWLSFNDASSRAVSLTPAMLMTGAAVGPLLGGLLVANFGFSGLGVVTLMLDTVAFLFFLRASRATRRPTVIAA